MRVCLATRHADARFTPLALLYLKAALVERGGLPASDVCILEFPPAADPADMAAAMLGARCDVLAVSCYVWNVIDLTTAAAAVKAAAPATRVVAGGPEVGPIGHDVLSRFDALDVVVKSEGEGPLVSLITAWAAGTAIESVAGIWRRAGAAIVEHADAPIVEDLNTLASPQKHEFIDPNGRIVCVETQRGCVFRCSFCFYNKDLSIRNRRFDLDRVKDELSYWLARDIKQLYLMDPVFNLNAARAKDLCRFIAERNSRRIPIHAEVWAEFIDDEMASLMKAAHFGLLEVGLQTTDTAALKIVERRLKMQPFIDGVGALRRHGISAELQLILGLPGDTLSTFRESIDFAARLQPDRLAAFTLMVLPGTELWRQARGLGLDYEPEPPYFIRSTPAMDRADIARARAMGPAVRILWNSRTVRLLSRERGSSFSALVDGWVDWCASIGASPHDTEDEAGLALRIADFVRVHCEERRIPPEFYLGVMRRELGA